jgi:hypothetical protein
MRGVYPDAGGEIAQIQTSSIHARRDVGGIILQKQVQTIAQEAWQDVEDLTAEAKAEVEATKKEADKKGNGTGQG